MSRRVLLLAVLLCLALLATAVAPWTVSGTIAGAVAQQLRDAYGLELNVAGRSTAALLPVPRLKFKDVTITAADGTRVAQAAQLTGELRIAPLFAGRIELAEAALHDAAIDLRLDAAGGTVRHLRQRANGRGATSSPVRRLIVTSGRVSVHDGSDRTPTTVEKVNLVASWPKPDGPIEASGSISWQDEPIDFSLSELRPGALASGAPTRFSVRLKSPNMSLSASGETSGPDGRSAGRLTLAARSVRDLAMLVRVTPPSARAGAALSLDGDFTAEGRLVSFPSARLGLGADRLEGALSLRLHGDRPAIAGTLASDQLDLSDAPTQLSQILGPEGAWSGDTVGSGDTGSVDIDVRLSASTARIGALRLDDFAGALLSKPGRIEASVGRAGLHRGTGKGRLTVTSVRNRADVRLQASLEGVDAAGLLADLGQARWLSGTTNAQVTLEAVGENASEVIRNMQGRASISVKQGELIGVGLPDLLRRVERRPLATSAEWRGGRTPFEQAIVSLNVAHGVGDVVEGFLSAPSVRGTLQGRVSVVDRTIAARAGIEAVNSAATTPSAGPAIVFDITGPLQQVSVVPDVRALINRSDAAQPLLGSGPTAAARALGYVPAAQ
jgi:AsmA protein